jgi:DNA polymerase elongation subunit (family B)
MKEFYTKDFQLFVEYNIQDVNLPDKLEGKLKLIEQTLSVAYLAKCNYTDVTAQVRTWDTLIYNWLHQENIVVPPKEHKEKKEKFEGAFVKEPIPGKYNWVVSFDVASLYPSIIRALNIGPETKLVQCIHKKSFTVEHALTNHDWFRNAATSTQKDEVTLAINGVSYIKSKQSFFSRMVETLFNNRKKFQGEVKAAKKELETCTDPVKQTELKNKVAKFDIKQKATKIMMNSLYGAFGNEFFRFYDIDNAEAVTLSGKFIIQFIERGLNRHLNQLFKTDKVDYIIAGDTDSVYVNLAPLVNHVFPTNGDPIKITRFLDKVCKEKLEKKIADLFEDITRNYLNGMWIPDKPILSMKREVIANPGIWSAKKHYILKVLNSEGDNFFECLDCHNKFSGPSEMVPCNKCKSTNVKRSHKLKIMGMEMVKSSMPKICRDAMKKATEIILDGTQDELVDFIDKTRTAFFKSPADVIAKPTGVKGLDKYSDDEDIYTTKTPLHTKAVLMYNWCVEQKGLQTKYPFITNSDKIKYVYLKLPNPIHEKAIAFPAKLPPEFKLEKFIDYHAMWELTFISPIKKILDPIGWSTEKQFDMDKFFK